MPYRADFDIKSRSTIELVSNNPQRADIPRVRLITRRLIERRRWNAVTWRDFNFDAWHNCSTSSRSRLNVPFLESWTHSGNLARSPASLNLLMPAHRSYKRWTIKGNLQPFTFHLTRKDSFSSVAKAFFFFFSLLFSSIGSTSKRRII